MVSPYVHALGKKIGEFQLPTVKISGYTVCTVSSAKRTCTCLSILTDSIKSRDSWLGNSLSKLNVLSYSVGKN